MRRNITPRQINITHRKNNNSNSTPKQNNINNNTTNLHSNQATIISKIHNELRKLENLEEILSTTESSFDRSLSILDLCTLCTKVSNTYNISDKTRAEKLVQILYSIEAYIKYLNIEKLTSILNKLKILNDVPILKPLVRKIEINIDIKKSQAENSTEILNGSSSSEVNNPVCWMRDFESSEAFKTTVSYQNYRKSRDLITQCFSTHNNVSSFQSNIRIAINIAINHGNLVKLSRFIVTCVYNSEMNHQFINCLVNESCSTHL